MVVLQYSFEVSKEEAEKILLDQDRRATEFKIKTKIELQDKDLRLENGVIVRASERNNKKPTK